MIPVKLQEPNNQKAKRPELITLLCILSFIGSGLAGFSNITIALAYHDLDEIIAVSGIDIPGLDNILSAGRSFFFVNFVLYSLSFTGVYNMWKLKKIGLHIYSISQIMLLIIPSFYFLDMGFPTIAVLVTSMFIILYASNIKHMT